MNLLEHLSNEWCKHLNIEFEKDYMLHLQQFINEQLTSGVEVYPPVNDFFNALNLTTLEKIKVVILGQDPYHGPGQAHGLAFSVPPGQTLPPSLVNIYREIESDLGCKKTADGCLQAWAKDGVLLLNTVLSVVKNKAASHRNQGWEQFTDNIIKLVDRLAQPSVFMLWGSYAQKKAALIDSDRHCVLQAPHPSPLSAYRGFFGCRHFSTANAFLQSMGREAVDWCS